MLLDWTECHSVKALGTNSSSQGDGSYQPGTRNEVPGGVGENHRVPKGRLMLLAATHKVIMWQTKRSAMVQ